MIDPEIEAVLLVPTTEIDPLRPFLLMADDPRGKLLAVF